MSVEDAARILHDELHSGGYARSWEHANPSERSRIRAAAAVLLDRMAEAS